MNRPATKGWCPGAVRPMLSGDGLIVRIRPRLCRLAADDVAALCAAANACGNSIIDFTSRGNIQLRGVRDGTYEALLARLDAARLIEHNPVIEARDNIIVSPVWRPDDDTARIAHELAARLGELPDLPAKFGFAIDASGPPLLATASADIRVERGASGALIVRADGATTGGTTTVDTAVDRIIELARWFAANAGHAARRMAHIAPPPIAADHAHDTPAPAADALTPGTLPLGPVYGVPFGSTAADDLVALMESSTATALRTTPWRLIVLEEAAPVDSDVFISDPSDPLLRVTACPGAPHCASATVETRPLARHLTRLTDGLLHVSGCTKGCARPSKAPVTVVGCDGRFDIVRDGHAWDPAEASGLDAAQVIDQLGVR